MDQIRGSYRSLLEIWPYGSTRLSYSEIKLKYGGRPSTIADYCLDYPGPYDLAPTPDTRAGMSSRSRTMTESAQKVKDYVS